MLACIWRFSILLILEKISNVEHDVEHDTCRDADRDKIKSTRATVSRLWHLGALRSRDSGVSDSVRFVIIITRIYMSRDTRRRCVCALYRSDMLASCLNKSVCKYSFVNNTPLNVSFQIFFISEHLFL